jgi:hypothetical protein
MTLGHGRHSWNSCPSCVDGSRPRKLGLRERCKERTATVMGQNHKQEQHRAWPAELETLEVATPCETRIMHLGLAMMLRRDQPPRTATATRTRHSARPAYSTFRHNGEDDGISDRLLISLLLLGPRRPPLLLDPLSLSANGSRNSTSKLNQVLRFKICNPAENTSVPQLPPTNRCLQLLYQKPRVHRL